MPNVVTVVIAETKEELEILHAPIKSIPPENRPTCPECGTSHPNKLGFCYTRQEKRQRFQCKSCHRIWTIEGYGFRGVRGGLHSDHPCPSCDSIEVRKAGVRTNRQGKRQQWNCRSCGRYWLDEFVEKFH